MVGGDRLGRAAEARTIIPMMAAGKRSVARDHLLFETFRARHNAGCKGPRALARSAGVRLVQIHDRELHGKFLLWDDDHLVITSLNWSSADTRSDTPQGEIGLYIKIPGVSANFRQRLIEGWPAWMRRHALLKKPQPAQSAEELEGAANDHRTLFSSTAQAFWGLDSRSERNAETLGITAAKYRS